MNKNIEHYFSHKENFLDEKYCENCINEVNKCTWQKHYWYNPNNQRVDKPAGTDEPEYLEPVDFSFDIAKINEFIIQELRSSIAQYIGSFEFDWFHSWTGYSPLKFIRYSPNQTMEIHCDHIQALFDGKKKGVPILSIIGILNDDYEGGELIMFEDKKINTKKGDLIIFPSNFMYPHKITPVTKGVRYSYVSWVW